jgi:hypothetical protein
MQGLAYYGCIRPWWLGLLTSHAAHQQALQAAAGFQLPHPALYACTWRTQPEPWSEESGTLILDAPQGARSAQQGWEAHAMLFELHSLTLAQLQL